MRHLMSLPEGERPDVVLLDDRFFLCFFISSTCLINETQIENTNWNLRSLANTNDLVTLKKNFSHIVIIIFLVSLAFSSIITFIVITKILRPLIKLENHMQNFENNLREFHLSEKTGYEIQNLVKIGRAHV